MAKSLKKIETDINKAVVNLEEMIETFSQLRFELHDRAEAGDKKAKELYEGWTRVMHNNLATAMEQKPD